EHAPPANVDLRLPALVGLAPAARAGHQLARILHVEHPTGTVTPRRGLGRNAAAPAVATRAGEQQREAGRQATCPAPCLAGLGFAAPFHGKAHVRALPRLVVPPAPVVREAVREAEFRPRAELEESPVAFPPERARRASTAPPERKPGVQALWAQQVLGGPEPWTQALAGPMAPLEQVLRRMLLRRKTARSPWEPAPGADPEERPEGFAPAAASPRTVAGAPRAARAKCPRSVARVASRWGRGYGAAPSPRAARSPAARPAPRS